MVDIRCPHCKNNLVFETFGQYGRIRKIGYNGQIQKRVTTVDYGGDDVIPDMVYCRQCGKDFKYKIEGEKIVSVEEKTCCYDYDDRY